MSGIPEPVSQQLDQLQTQVDRVLEQIGRVFAVINSGSKTSSASQVTRLRQIFPGSLSRFHDALDNLEEQLQTAQLVIRRDYSLWRNQSGLAIDTYGSHAAVAGTDPVSQTLDEDVEMSDAKVDATRDDDDADMADAKANIEARDISNDTSAAENRTENNASQAPTPPADSKAQKPHEPVDESSDSKDSAALHIDTKTDRAATEVNAPPQNDEEKPPDTGTFSNNADLDSLFNDPITAGGVDDDPAPPDFDPTGDFDFGAFNASLGEEHARGDEDQNNVNPNDDNDNIDALIPGLQDYANNVQSENEPDYDALFAGGDENGENPPHDSTFDDLMDFADFNAGDWMAGDGQAEG